MARNFVQPGNTITVPAAAVTTSGDVVIFGSMVGVAANTAAIGAALDIEIGGVWELPKVSALAIAIGDKVYFDAATQLTNKTASGNTYLGVAVSAAANPSASVRVRLNPSF